MKLFVNRRFEKAVLLSLFSLFAVSGSAHACTCEYTGGTEGISKLVENARARSTAVFTGTVIEEIPFSGSSFVTKYRFKVIRAWKGVDKEEVTILTGHDGTMCGFPFDLGGTYLVYAFGKSATTLGTNICQRTKPLSDDTEDLKYLGKPEFAWGETVNAAVH